MKLARTIALVPILSLSTGVARAEPAMTIATDVGVVRRTTLWRDDLFGALRDYALGGAPALGLEATLFPGAFFTRGRAGYVGLTGRVEALLGVDSKRAPHAGSIPTRAGAVAIAVRGRLPLRHGWIALDAGVASRTFLIDASGATAPDFPSVRYLGPRAALTAEISLPRGFSLTPRGALSRWVEVGDLGSSTWFPHARSWGAELGLRAAWTTRVGVGPYLDFAWSRDVTALRPQPGEGRVAGGLADDRLSARVGLSVSFPARGR